MCSKLKKILCFTFLITFLTFNSQIVANAEQGYKESPLNAKDTYDNFMISLLNEKLTQAIEEHYGKSLVGFTRPSEEFIKVQQLTKEYKNDEIRNEIKYIVTFSISPIVEENGKRITKDADTIQFEVLTDPLGKGDSNKGIKLKKYEQHK